ncbi:MAG: WG repeat-containing protein [Bacteroidota bacterium]
MKSELHSRLLIFASYLLLLMLLVSCGSDDHVYKRPLLAVKKENGWGFVNRNKEIVIDPIYAYAFDFSEGRAAVNIGGTSTDGKMPLDGKWGFINMRDTIVINPVFDGPPRRYAAPYNSTELSQMMYEGYVFSESLAAVRRDNEWVYIDTIGNVVIRSPKGYSYTSVRSFHNGLAAVRLSTNGRWGFINKSGQLVIENIFLFPADFIKETALQTDINGDKVLINQKGEVLLAEYRLDKPFNEGYAPIKGKFKEVQRSSADEVLYGLVDSLGNMLIEPQFDRMGEFGSGLAPVLIGSKQEGLVRFPSSSTSSAYTGGKWTFVDKDRQIKFDPVFQEAHAFRHGLAAVKKNGHWGYIDTEGKFVVKPELLWAGDFHDHMAVVRLGENSGAYYGRYAYINTDGDVFHVLEP